MNSRKNGIKSNTRQRNQKTKQMSSVGNWIFSIITLVLVACITYQIVLPKIIRYDNGKRPKTVEASVLDNGNIVIPIKDIKKNAIFLSYDQKGTELEIVALLASDGTFRTAFNTCQVCFRSGRGYYIQQGNYLVCQNCGNKFHRDKVEKVRGGCNPISIGDEVKEITDTEIIISADYLSDAVRFFSHWGKM